MIKLEAAALTDSGRQRSTNEDRVWAQTYSPSEGEVVGLFIVCDGIGGYMGGEVASHWAVEAVKHELNDLFCPPDPRATVHLSSLDLEAALQGDATTRLSALRRLEERVRRAVEKANQVVYEYAQQRPEKAGEAGTTIVMGLVLGERAVIANVGDSRAYLIHQGQIQQITRDHSLVASLVAAGQIQPHEVYTHPQRNLIFRSLGHKKDITVDTFVQMLTPGDTLLFCSDGLWEMVQDDETLARLTLAAPSAAQACQALVEAANQAGGEDNIGVVVVRIT